MANRNGRRDPNQLELLKKLFKPTREERTREMDEEILSVEGAAKALGVSTRTIYNLARSGDIPAMRIGREWRFAPPQHHRLGRSWQRSG